MHEESKHNARLDPLADLIDSVDRPGDYCAHGQVLAPMPRIRVGTGEILSFPIPPAQAVALIESASRAPYGRGPETIVDRTVRDCWQIEPGRVEVGGRAWPETLRDILRRTAEGLGYSSEAVSASLYKVLIYERGGFFAPHRDTEKTDGMVATLVISLPVAGTGGELVVRHRDRETTVDMLTDEPSELVYAAFYADCEHEIHPVTEGYRVCLVYNLVVEEGRSVPTKAPDYGTKVAAIADELDARFRDPESAAKLVWMLEHDYSEAGLSFRTLKNTDSAVGRVMMEAARRAGCVLHAATVHIEEHASVIWYGGWEHETEDVDESDYDLVETVDSLRWLDGWVCADGMSAEYGKLELCDGELMRADELADEEPDSHRLFEATGNEGASVERLYRRAALVVWPQAESMKVLAPAGGGALVSFVEAERDRERAGTGTGRSVRDWACELAKAWPKPSPTLHYLKGGIGSWREHCVKALQLLHAIGNRSAVAHFLETVVLPYYGAAMNDALVAVISREDAREMGVLLDRLVRSQLGREIDGILNLICILCERLDGGRDTPWRPVLRETVLVACASLHALCRPRDDARGTRTENRMVPVSVDTLQALFRLVWRYDLEQQASEAASFFRAQPDLLPPDRNVPTLLAALHTEHGNGRTGTSAAFEALWRHGAAFLLCRSSHPPAPPKDWTLPIDGLRCSCERCDALRQFCLDGEARVRHFAVRQDLRSHLRQQIETSGIDMCYKTERRGNPHRLVCTKTRASHENRMQQYNGDIVEMRRLIGLARSVPGVAGVAEDLSAAVGRAQS